MLSQRIASMSALALIGALTSSPALAQDGKSAAEATYRDIEQTLGAVPGFLRQFPETGIVGAWAEFKAVQLGPHTKMSGKTKELIGLAVAEEYPYGSGVEEGYIGILGG